MIFLYDGLIFLLTFVVWPIAVAFGWVRVIQTGWPKALLPRLSFVAHVIATISLVTAIILLVLLHASNNFDDSSPIAMTMFLWLFRGSIAALVLGIAGAFRSGPLRWFAPLAAFTSILPWFIELSIKL